MILRLSNTEFDNALYGVSFHWKYIMERIGMEGTIPPRKIGNLEDYETVKSLHGPPSTRNSAGRRGESTT